MQKNSRACNFKCNYLHSWKSALPKNSPLRTCSDPSCIFCLLPFWQRKNSVEKSRRGESLSPAEITPIRRLGPFPAEKKVLWIAQDKKARGREKRSTLAQGQFWFPYLRSTETFLGSLFRKSRKNKRIGDADNESSSRSLPFPWGLVFSRLLALEFTNGFSAAQTKQDDFAHENIIFMGSPANPVLVEKTDESGFLCSRGRGVALMGGGDKGLAKAINGEGG